MAKKKHYEWRIGKPLPVLGEHSIAKHRILDRYMRRYIEICTSTPVQEKLNLTIVDGYCGGGRYSFNDDELPGSPLVLLRAVAEMQESLNSSRPKGFKIQTDFIFIDKNKHHTEFLRNEIRNSPFSIDLDKTIQIWTNDFNTCVDEAILVSKKRSRKGRSLFILDQYGWSNVVFSKVRKILAELEKAEIFLNFPVDSLISYMSEEHVGRKSYKNIDASPEFVQELLSYKDEHSGWRTLIQNELYKHIQNKTNAEFYSPFFIKSPLASRSYWFLHLSRHREARNEIGKIHWQESNVSVHHGGAGLRSLGFSPGRDPRQMAFGYSFDENARQQSRNALTEQIPRLIREALNADVAPSLEDLFGTQCNDTPITRSIFEGVLSELRTQGEIRIEDAYGKEKPRSLTVNWSDRIIMSPQRSFFGPFGID